MDPLGWNLEHEYFFFFIEDFLRIDDTIFKFLSKIYVAKENRYRYPFKIYDFVAVWEEGKKGKESEECRVLKNFKYPVTVSA